jgi:hypothetical protein
MFSRNIKVDLEVWYLALCIKNKEFDLQVVFSLSIIFTEWCINKQKVYESVSVWDKD